MNPDTNGQTPDDTPDDTGDDNRDDVRLVTLEFKIMELENTLQELNQVILDQYRDLDKLNLSVQALTQRLAADDRQDGSHSPNSAADEVPPHY